MKYCIYLTFQVHYDSDESEMVEMTATGDREIMTDKDVERARRAVMRRMERCGKKIKAINLIHSLKTIHLED